MTIGTGYFGRSSVGENVGPQHLMQWVKVAWNKDASVRMPSLDGIELPNPEHIGRPPVGAIDYDFGNPPGARPTTSRVAASAGDGDIRAEIRRIILEELKSLGAR
jgi:hypothetical protein